MDMKSKFSEKVKYLEGSAIREMFKLMAKPEIISFAGGSPDSNLFPNEALAEISNEILKKNGAQALQYGITEGYPQLKEWVINRLKNQGIIDDKDDTIIVSGGQQGIDLASKALLNAGDGIVCEEPSFIGGLNCFRSYNAEIFGVDVKDDGLDTDQLEKVLKEHKNIKILYTIATFQNPSGITMSYEKRLKVLELAEKYDFIIFEDNPYGELRFSGDPVPTLKSLDKNGRVVYFGSFSKILSPGMRVGFVVAPEEVAAKMVVAKQSEDVHTNQFFQMLCYKFMTQCDLDAHIQKIRDLYGRKCNLMLSCLEKELPASIKFTRPEGGLFIWVTLPDGVDANAFLKAAIAEKLMIVPGATFNCDTTEPSQSFRLNYSTPSDEQIVEGVARLGKVARAFVQA